MSVPRGGLLVEIVDAAQDSPTNASKGYSGPHESIPMVSDNFHVDGFLADLNQALSALKQNPLPGSALRGTKGSQGGFWPPPTQTLHLALLSAIGGSVWL